MSEELTGRLNDDESFESRVLEQFARLRESVSSLGTRFSGVEQRLGDVDSRLLTLEERVDARLKETRPLWEAVLLRLDKIETRLDSMDTRLERVEDKFDVVAGQWLDVRADIGRLKKRLPPPEVTLTPNE